MPAQPLDNLSTTPESDDQMIALDIRRDLILWYLISWEFHFLLYYLPEERILTSTLERTFADQHDIKHDTEGPPLAMFQHICKDQKATSPRPLCMEETAATLGPRNWACHTKSWLCLADACPELKDLRLSKTSPFCKRQSQWVWHDPLVLASHCQVSDLCAQCPCMQENEKCQ